MAQWLVRLGLEDQAPQMVTERPPGLRERTLGMLTRYTPPPSTLEAELDPVWALEHQRRRAEPWWPSRTQETHTRCVEHPDGTRITETHTRSAWW